MHCFPTCFKRGNFSAWYTFFVISFRCRRMCMYCLFSPLWCQCSMFEHLWVFYSCRCKFDSYFWKRKTCKGLWSVESRDSSVVSSQRGVTLLCEFSLLGNKVFLLRSNSTGNLIQKAKNLLQYAKRSVSVDAITVSILAIPVNLAGWNMSRSQFCVVNFHFGKTISGLCCLFSDINECTDYSPS